MLGQSHAENDQDRLAISCLERAVEMDPYSLDALLVREPDCYSWSVVHDRPLQDKNTTAHAAARPIASHENA